MKELSEEEIRSFQQSRGLTVTGSINDVTARALEESRWKLGDRSLYLQESPLMRGDDVAALQSRHLAGAALDVFATEPLPSDSPLWDMDNVIITPHSSSASAQSGLRSEDIFLKNLARYVAGEPMVNEVHL
jgi:hypothetical protein